MLCYAVEIGILNVIESNIFIFLGSYFLWSLFSFLNYQFLNYLVNNMSNNMNMEDWVVFASHWKSRKLLLMLFDELKYYQRKSERLFELILVFQSSFGVRYIRVFCKFAGWSLLWATTMVLITVVTTVETFLYYN